MMSDVYEEILLGLSNGINFKEFVTKFLRITTMGLGWRKLQDPRIFKNPIKGLK